MNEKSRRPVVIAGWCVTMAGLLLALAVPVTALALVAMDLPDSSLEVASQQLTLHLSLRDAWGDPVPGGGRIITLPLTSTWWGFGIALAGTALVQFGRWR